MNLLVAYTTCREPVRAIAEHLAIGLRQLGVAADACAAIDLVEVGAYDGIVLGSAIRAGEWLPDGTRFAVENTAVLRQRPTWLFSVSADDGRPNLFCAHTAARLRSLRREAEQVDALRHLTDPIEYRYFTANVVGSAWVRRARAAIPVLEGRLSWHSDWTAIDAWARSIAADVAFREGIANCPAVDQGAR